MKIRFLTPALHGLLDYAAAGALIVLPFVLKLGSEGPLALWLSVAGGIGLILYSLLTDYAFGAVKALPYNAHLVLDLTAGALFLAAPWLFGLGPIASVYYPIMALGVIAVVALSSRSAPLQPNPGA